MYVDLDGLIPFERLKTDLEDVIGIVEINGKVVLLKDNEPAIILKCDSVLRLPETTTSEKAIYYTFHEAMKIVLLEAEDNTMHAATLALRVLLKR